MRKRVINIICIIGMLGVAGIYIYEGKDIEMLLTLILVQLTIMGDILNGK